MKAFEKDSFAFLSLLHSTAIELFTSASLATQSSWAGVSLVVERYSRIDVKQENGLAATMPSVVSGATFSWARAKLEQTRKVDASKTLARVMNYKLRC